MKKLSLFLGIISFLAVSCGPSTEEQAAKVKADSLRVADSLKIVDSLTKAVVADTTKVDTLKKK